MNWRPCHRRGSTNCFLRRLRREGSMCHWLNGTVPWKKPTKRLPSSTASVLLLLQCSTDRGPIRVASSNATAPHSSFRFWVMRQFCSRTALPLLEAANRRLKVSEQLPISQDNWQQQVSWWSVASPMELTRQPTLDALTQGVKRLQSWDCLLYTSDAADDLTRVDLGGRRIIKK